MDFSKLADSDIIDFLYFYKIDTFGYSRKYLLELIKNVYNILSNNCNNNQVTFYKTEPIRDLESAYLTPKNIYNFSVNDIVNMDDSMYEKLLNIYNLSIEPEDKTITINKFNESVKLTNRLIRILKWSDNLKERKLIIIFPASAGWNEDLNNPSGQMTRSDQAHKFVNHLKLHNIQIEAYFVDPKFATPSLPDKLEISKFPPEFKAVGTTSQEFIDSTYIQELLRSEHPIAYVTLGMFPIPTYDGIDYSNSNQINYVHKNIGFLDPFVLLEIGNYDITKNRYNRTVYNFKPGQPLLDDSINYRLMLAYQIIPRLQKLKKLNQNDSEYLESYRDMVIFLNDHYPDLLNLLIQGSYLELINHIRTQVSSKFIINLPELHKL